MRCHPQGRKNAWSLQSLRGYFVLDVSVQQFAFRGIVGCLTGVQRNGNDLSMPPTSTVACCQGIIEADHVSVTLEMGLSRAKERSR